MTIQRIEIDVFSGRPNPGWAPATADAVLLQEALLFDKEINCGTVPDTLGYKGFIITFKDAEAGMKSVRVYDGKLSLNNGKTCYADTRQLERRLIEQAKKNGFAQLISDLHL